MDCPESVHRRIARETAARCGKSRFVAGAIAELLASAD
jgi:hypothetical protein